MGQYPSPWRATLSTPVTLRISLSESWKWTYITLNKLKKTNVQGRKRRYFLTTRNQYQRERRKRCQTPFNHCFMTLYKEFHRWLARVYLKTSNWKKPIQVCLNNFKKTKLIYRTQKISCRGAWGRTWPSITKNEISILNISITLAPSYFCGWNSIWEAGFCLITK